MKLTILLLSALFFLPAEAKLTKEQKKELRKTTRWLSSFDLRYAKPWTPPGDSKPINMDCSNTARYLYKKALSIDLPSGGSYDMYKYYKSHRQSAKSPKKGNEINVEKLSSKLKSGDLLFWINTHSDIDPSHTPPISHVMIYLGRSRKTGEMKMVGANTFGKGDFTEGGGPDVYTFDPNEFIGCVRTDRKNRKSPCIKGKESKFFAFARPVIQSESEAADP